MRLSGEDAEALRASGPAETGIEGDEWEWRAQMRQCGQGGSQLKGIRGTQRVSPQQVFGDNAHLVRRVDLLPARSDLRQTIPCQLAFT